ncbi:MAG: hypothetical protein KJ042_11840 [Deltaproteobacteria bacterium]|nr:hypothetical protein [Deltaproteobacteria bacterium]
MKPSRIFLGCTMLAVVLFLVTSCSAKRPVAAMASATQAVNDLRFSATLVHCPELGREAEDELRQMREAFERRDDSAALGHSNRAHRLAEQVKACRPKTQ